MKVVVFTPTCRPGGIDVALASILRQDRPLHWLIGDELYEQRSDIYKALDEMWGGDGIELHPFDTAPLHQPGFQFTLAAAYRQAMNMARDLDADLFVSMQDYIWVPEDGIDRFIQMAHEHPRSLLTGLTSLSDDPGVDKIADHEGLYTIFAEPYTRKPRKIGWRDCRLEMYSGFERIAPSSWETNWAAIPRELLHHPDLDFDVSYDRGHAYENQGYAARALVLGFDAWIDCDNESIGLPHKAYFPEQEAHFEETNNRLYHEQRLGEMGVYERERR